MIITFSVTLGKTKFDHKYKVVWFDFKLYKSYTCLDIRGARPSDSFFFSFFWKVPNHVLSISYLARKYLQAPYPNPVSEKLPLWINIALNFGPSVQWNANSRQTYMKFLTRCPLLLFDVAREKDNFPARNWEKSKKSKEIFPKEEKGTHHICNNFFLANHKLHKDKKYG